MRKVIAYIGLMVLLFIVGFIVTDYFFNFSSNQIKNIQVTSPRVPSGLFSKHLTFAFSIGIIPLLYFMVNKVAKLKLNQSIYTVGLIIISGILFWWTRVFLIDGKIQRFFGFNYERHIDYTELNFEKYLFAGIVVGAILSVLIFSIKNKNSKIH